MLAKLNAITAALAGLATLASAQTYQRLGTCPDLGCVLPPDQADFLPGQRFDLRVEVHAPVNGSEAAHNGKPDQKFKVTIIKDADDGKDGKSGKSGKPKKVHDYFGIKEPELETWTFSWYEDLFAEDEDKPSVVNVASRVYRNLALYEPGTYTVTLQYYGKETTTAKWTVRDLSSKRKAKNVIFFIGDGMTTNMITAARLLGHKTINGKYQSIMKLDEFPVLGHQMTHSVDSYITDSANSASALYTGHKSTVDSMGVYSDSSEDPFDDPKVETIVEIFKRVHGGPWGAVSTAHISDATPAALTGHTRRRGEYAALVDQGLNGNTNYTWTNHGGPDVYFGGGADQFLPGEGSYEGRDYYEEFAKKGYAISLNRTSLLEMDHSEKSLGIFCKGVMPVWLDRNVYTDNLEGRDNDPAGGEGDALDLPGLRDMATKAVEILHTRSKKGKDDEEGFFLMVEAASVDKQMHALDYDRALGDLLELDDTVRATFQKLEELDILDETLIVVSADHGHGFDVYGSADTKYLAAQDDDRHRRRAIGTYEQSGLSQYHSKPPSAGGSSVTYGTGANFPTNWEPRYAIAAGFGAMPDHREDYRVRKSGPREATVKIGDEYYANPEDAEGPAILVNGTLPTSSSNGVHSLTDVPVFAHGPCQELFGGTYSNIDIFYKMAECLGLAVTDEDDD